MDKIYIDYIIHYTLYRQTDAQTVTLNKKNSENHIKQGLNPGF